MFPSVPWGGITFMSGDGTAVCSGFKIGHATFRQQAHFIEFDNLVIIGRRCRNARHDVLQKCFSRCVDNLDPFVDLSKGCSDRDAIKWHGSAAMSRQNERVRGKREQLVQAVVERGGACLCLLFVCFQIGPSDTSWEKGVSCE